MTVSELDVRMTRREMTQWIAFYRHEQREQERAAKAADKQRR